MKLTPIQSPQAPPASNYAQALAVSDVQQWLYISGQIPQAADATVAADFASQCRTVWANIQAQLDAAGMRLDNLVKVTTFLSDRCYRAENQQIRQQVLGQRKPALTVIIAGIYEEAWLLEIEAIAAR